MPKSDNLVGDEGADFERVRSRRREVRIRASEELEQGVSGGGGYIVVRVSDRAERGNE